MEKILLLILVSFNLLVVAQDTIDLKQMIPENYTKSDTFYYDSTSIKEIIFYMDNEVIMKT